MQPLNPDVVLRSIYKARSKYRNGTLKDSVKDSVKEDFWQTDTINSADKKQQILNLAKTGKPKPVYHKDLLAKCMSNYMKKKSGCYDAEFTKTIKKLRPEWFQNTADANKKKIIQLAKSGKPKPLYRHSKLGTVLSHYISQSRNSYDEEFKNNLMKLRPDWFVDTAKIKKEQIIKMAEEGLPRPVYGKHLLAKSLITYIRPNHTAYDSAFTKKIKKLRPDWFVSRSDKAKQKKVQLLKMAQNNEPRPGQKKHPLGADLSRYTSTSNGSFDPAFNKKIRKIRPDWFKHL